jgi:hypothetical protein
LLNQGWLFNQGITIAKPAGNGNAIKFETRHRQYQTNSNDQNTNNSERFVSVIGVLNMGVSCSGFRIASFGFG